MKFIGIDRIRDMDAIILAVAHDKFRKFALTDFNKMYGDGKKVLLDIKGILDQREYETAGYIYWRL